MQRNWFNYLIISLKGLAMGAADVVPGVSGGTIAFISGIYEELIDSIKSVNLPNLKLLLKGDFKGFWQAVNGNFLLSLVAGIGLSILSLAKLLKYILENNPVLLWSFFFGLVVASAITVAGNIPKWDWKKVLALIFGTAIAYLITSMTPAETTDASWFLFLCGAIAICAMILPGVSGAFILLMFGKYQFFITALTNIEIKPILLLMSGAGIGIMMFSRLLSWLLHRFHDITIAILAGFMIGSLNKIWPWKQVLETYIDRHGEVKPLFEPNVLPTTYESVTGEPAQIVYAALLAVAGFLLIWIMEKATSKK
ncbi:DUF368 domain-containing protein [Prolixibacteraceae bacterium JC049]|nr:DUF368 domain-containing protein [Prolixibacteraceae bacterium JC049]